VVLALIAVAAPGLARAADLTIGIGDDPGSLDPATNASFVGREVLQSVCDKLVDIDTAGNLVPMLATAWDWSPDGRTLTLKLRENVVYHDGEPFDAESVRWNLDRYLTQKDSRRRSEINVIDKVEVVDPRTARLILKQPSVSLLAQFTDRAGMMVSRKAYDAAPAQFTTHPLCAGPYKFAEYKSQDHATVERFPQHWRAGQYHFDRLIFRPIPDSTVRLLNLRSGQLDVIEQISPSSMGTVEQDPSLKLAAAKQPAYESIVFNLNGKGANPEFGKKAALRQAFSLAIDRAAINEVVFDGRYLPGNQPFPSDSPWFDEDHPVPPRDVAAAKAKMKEAGVSHATLTLLVSTNTEEQQVAQAMQAMLAEVGIDLKIVPTEFIAMRTQAAQGNFEAYMVGSSGRVDPDLNISLAVSCGAANNVGLYCNEALDKILAEARATADPAKRKPLYKKAMTIMLTDLPDVFLYNQRGAFALKSTIKGFSAFPDGIPRFEGVEGTGG
jgi:peptide/nickel transport system substrate-binding protein